MRVQQHNYSESKETFITQPTLLLLKASHYHTVMMELVTVLEVVKFPFIWLTVGLDQQYIYNDFYTFLKSAV